jgi:NlpC/P60 family putative phage cell wall peptidase
MSQAAPKPAASVSRAQIVQQARNWLGTPYQHQARCRGAGVDCIGLISSVAKELELSSFDSYCYGRIPNGKELITALQQHAIELPANAPWLPGQILALRFDIEPQHAAILGTAEGGLTMIHAYSHAKCVTEHRLADVWRARVVARFDFPGVV